MFLGYLKDVLCVVIIKNVLILGECCMFSLRCLWVERGIESLVINYGTIKWLS